MLARGLLRSSAAFEVCPKMASSKRSSSSADPRKEKLRKEIQTARETIAIKNTKVDQMELRQCEYTMEMDAIGSRFELTKPAKDKDNKSFEKKFETASESESQSS